MDELVKTALAKWPDVPDCTGWLELDARGRWRIGDTKDGRRQPITHAAMISFINRNYTAHDRYWIFQNGPQRVFVELEYTPFVWRLAPRDDAGWNLVAHTGTVMTPTAIWLDDGGRFLVEARADDKSPPVIGVVHDHDTVVVSELLRAEDGHPLDDEAMVSLSSGQECDLAAAGLPGVNLRWSADGADIVMLPLQRISPHRVAARFAFEPKPAVALRVDVDTRR